MTCAPTDRLMQTLRVHVPGVTDALLQLELFNVMDTFFRRTSAWRYEDSITLDPGQEEYAFAVPADSQVVRLLGVSHNSTPVPSATQIGFVQSSLGELVAGQVFPDGDAEFVPAVTDLNASNIFSYAVYRPNYIQITGEVTEEKAQYPLKTLLALTIARSCLECDCGDWALEDWMYDMFFQDWLDGVLGTLYGMPAKPWGNPQLALMHQKRFRNRMAFRKQEATKGFTYEVPGWRFPRGGWV